MEVLLVKHGGMCLCLSNPHALFDYSSQDCVNWELQGSSNCIRHLPTVGTSCHYYYFAYEVFMPSETRYLQLAPALVTVVWEKVEECGCPDDHATPTEVSPGQPRLHAALHQ